MIQFLSITLFLISYRETTSFLPCSRRCQWLSTKQDPSPLFSSDPFNLSELQSRIENLQRIESQELKGIVDLHVLAFDALLPKQRLNGSTTDPTFSRFLQQLGIGGVFVMTSLDFNHRKIRRDGVLCKIDVVDASRDTPQIPTAVDFSIVGIKHCRVCGPATQMVVRIGRWRRGYDADGEEPRLGWGKERFVDGIVNETNDTVDKVEDSGSEAVVETVWTTTRVHILSDLEDEVSKDPGVIVLSEQALDLLDQWEKLAANERTYENTDVVATARIKSGFPGLYVNPAALLRKVRSELGPVPSPNQPSQLAFYGAALINPLPALGVAPEIRGRILSAPTTSRRLEILIWGIERSIQNLKGIRPL